MKYIFIEANQVRKISPVEAKNTLINIIIDLILLHKKKILQFDWLKAVVFQLKEKYLHVKITNLLRVAV